MFKHVGGSIILCACFAQYEWNYEREEQLTKTVLAVPQINNSSEHNDI